MAAAKRSKVTVDINNNRLVVIYAGKITKKVLSDLYTDVRFCVADLQPGFDVVADFRDAQVFVLNGIPIFRKIGVFVMSSGASNIVRVLDPERLAETQLGNFVTRVQGFRPIVASTLEEADKKLETYAKRDGMRIYLFHAPVEYLIGETKGDGDIYNISVSGIAINIATIVPPVDEEILVKVSFPNQKDKPFFDIKARVVRHSGESSFAAQFVDFDDTHREKLWKVLLVESQEEML